MIERAAPLALLAASYLALMVCAATGSVGWVATAAVGVAAAEVGVARRWDRIERTLTKLSFGFARRRFVIDALLVVAVAQARGITATARTVLVAGLVAGSLVAAGYLALRRLDVDRPAVMWRNVVVDRPTWGRSRTDGFRLLSLPCAAIVAALLAGREDGGTFGTGLTVALVVVAVATPAAVVAALAAHVADTDRPAGTPDDDLRRALLAAWEALAPQVVVHFGGPDSSTHVVNVWTPSLAALDTPTAVIVRERVHLDRVAAHGLPVVFLPRNTDVELFATPTVGLALYPTNIVKNNHLIRIPGIVDVFVGHGDSDKAGSASPISRIYDQVWVAGAAGRDRYRRARVGVRDDQIREIGRPQLADIRRAARPRPTGEDRDERGRDGAREFTVLYAPTWEGFYAAWSYSSVLSMGSSIVQCLLSIEGVRVVYKPHPATGSQDGRYARADAAIRELIRAAGAPHEVMTGVGGLYTAFNASDLLVSDVSSVVTDFLFSRKPYVVTNPHGLHDSAFRTEYPSSAGAALVTPSSVVELQSIVDDARGPDSRAPQRAEVATYLLGPDRPDPLDEFAEAIDAVLHGR